MVYDINSVEFKSVISQCKEIFNEINLMIPSYIFGIDKLNYCKETLDGLSEEKKQVLRSFFDSILFEMHKIEASDLDFGGHGCLGKFWMRIQGVKEPYELLPEFNINEANILILNILSEKQIEYLFENRNLDFSYTVNIEVPYSKVFRFRADAYFELDNLSINIRAILSSIRPFESLNFHPNVAKVMNINYMKEGLILITGITGSGKSSTLDSIIDENNKTSHSHIIIISSPVEYIHTSKKCVVKHREVGRDVHSFKDGTIQALRQDPDIIVI
ncbi:MAG: ATPase, T2SS/T4P/T4SS family, partial [Ignavibacteria bacterium]|nr:ATPase, T2SS/T4P/T4SS family [Ignavibacteria bacterium]